MMQFRLRTLLVCVAILATAFACLAFVGKITEYPRHQSRGARLLETLDTRCPATVSPQTWDDATGWAITAYHNICFNANHTTLKELDSFVADTEERLNGPVDLATIDWIWARLAATGPHGEAYASRFLPQYRATVYGIPITPAGR